MIRRGRCGVVHRATFGDGLGASKRISIGRRTADWRLCRAGIRSDLSEGVKAISGNRGDEKQTRNLDHEKNMIGNGSTST